MIIVQSRGAAVIPAEQPGLARAARQADAAGYGVLIGPDPEPGTTGPRNCTGTNASGKRCGGRGGADGRCARHKET